MKVYIETYGCQMNEYDSAMVRSMLAAAGYTLVGGPEAADVVIVNTCSVRDRAEQRALGRLRHLRGLMPRGALLGVIGCVAQRLGDDLARRVRGTDFIVGTDCYRLLIPAIAAARSGRRSVAVEADPAELYDDRPPPIDASVSDFVSVMRGCDNFCSYCIVPYVRGRERSRPVAAVVAEVGELAARGTKEVALIGQNVNSYRDDGLGFADLLARVDGVPGIARIRFATSHPKDLSDLIIEAVASLGKVCEHVHLPVQSGSDAVLAAMRRSYTRLQYLGLVARTRERIPGIALTTDVIVGFPGESDDDFTSTLSLMEEVRFDSAFMFRYSPRAGTRAAALEDDVPERTKIARLGTVIALQKRITEERNVALAGTEQEVLVEGESERDRSRLFGRTRTAKPVVFEGPRELCGSLVRVRITGASAWTLSAVRIP
jgi:tRNA-2-methylthio-N6-dimethylallyladenosine synthase